MEQSKIFALTERIKQTCPEDCNVEIVPTKQRDDIYLIVIRFSSTSVDLHVKPMTKADMNAARLQASFTRDPLLKSAYDWERQKIHNFHYEVIMPLIENNEHFRVFYYTGGRFVFYPHIFGCLRECANTFNYVGMNDMMYYKYIGNCRNTDWLIGYLMTTFNKF